MSELLLELFSEEIPARMQSKASADLKQLVITSLQDAGLSFETAHTYETPRRLTLVIEGLSKKSPDIREERRGPRVGAPEKAVQGFLRGAGLNSIDDAQVINDPKKGDFYLAVIEREGRPTSDVIAEIVPDSIQKFPWPKSMRWGAGKLRWVRPLQSILCVFNGKIVDFEVDGIKSGNTTQGHRFMAPKSFKVKNFGDYHEKLGQAYVIISTKERAAMILEEATATAQNNKLILVEDKALLAETAGLVEWPVVLMGSFDKEFLDVPPEVLSTSMKSHQKCFSLKTKNGKLANKFLLVSNLIAEDGGEKIINGNERVIRARLSDAKFFWDNDKSRPLEDLLPKLELVTFHEKLGTQAQRVERIMKLALELAPIVNADPSVTEQAAQLCKADLMTETVGEFPELQGLTGQYIALAQLEDEHIAQACAEHYKPQGPSDELPNSLVSIAVALADKLDTLVGFWAIDEKPTGSKDPYALRRAALGVIRIVLSHNIRLPFKAFFDKGMQFYREQKGQDFGTDAVDDFLVFFADRLKVYLRDQGADHDLIDAVYALGDQDDLLMIVMRVEALGQFLDTDDGANLLAGVKRAANILRIEEKKDKASYKGEVDKTLFREAEEKTLHKAILAATKAAEKAVMQEDFETAMSAMADLREPVDTFFEHVIVNHENAEIRDNRLKLLSQIRSATHKVADFSKIEG